jgi:hypothetical protein
MTIKYVMAGIIIVLAMTLSQPAMGSGARMDWSDKYTDIPGAPECWVDGYDDGLASVGLILEFYLYQRF